jgi:hypothetical protein
MNSRCLNRLQKSEYLSDGEQTSLRWCDKVVHHPTFGNFSSVKLGIETGFYQDAKGSFDEVAMLKFSRRKVDSHSPIEMPSLLPCSAFTYKAGSITILAIASSCRLLPQSR